MRFKCICNNITIKIMTSEWKIRFPHQCTLLKNIETGLHRHDHNEWEEANNVKEASAKAGNGGLVKTGADQVTEGQDGQAVVAEVQEEDEAVTVRQDAAMLENQCEDDDGHHQVSSAIQEPGDKVAEWVYAHHLHIL